MDIEQFRGDGEETESSDTTYDVDEILREKSPEIIDLCDKDDDWTPHLADKDVPASLNEMGM